MSLDFTNGIVPETGVSCQHGSIKNFFSPSEIQLRLAGRSSKCSVGGKVRIGMPLTDGDDPLYAGISGTVSYIDGEIIRIKSDFEGTLCESLKKADKPLDEYTFNEIYALIRHYGIFDGTDGKPLCDKLLQCKKPKRIIINCAEVDFRSDAVCRLISEDVFSLAGGAKILSKALGVPKIVFVCTENSKALIKLLKDTFADEQGFVIAVLKQKYPVIPRTVFSALYGRHIPNLSRPEDIGYLMIAAETAIQTYNSFVTGVPQVYKLVSLVGECMKNKVNARVPVGTGVVETINYFGGVIGRKVELLSGSVFQQNRIPETARIGFETNQLAAVRALQIKGEKCMRCGECINACPMLLDPMRYALLHEAKQPYEKYTYAEHCIGCGCCEFVCPSSIPLMSVIAGGAGRKNSVEEM